VRAKRVDLCFDWLILDDGLLSVLVVCRRSCVMVRLGGLLWACGDGGGASEDVVVGVEMDGLDLRRVRTRG